MKRPLNLALFLFFCGHLAPAQSYLGISGGGGIDSEVFFRAGIPFEIEWNDHLAFQTELTYIARENREVLLKLIGDREYWQSTITYLELPFLAKIKMDFKSVSLYAFGGPKLGYGIRLAANYSEGRIFFEERFDFDKKGITRFDMGVNIGAGIEMQINNHRKIFLNYRYYLGLFDIDTSPDSDIHNQGAVFCLGFMIPLGNRKSTK